MIIMNGIIILRAIEKTDLELLRELWNDPSIENGTSGYNFPISEYSQLKWFENNDFRKDLRCMIDVVGKGTIGICGLINIDWKNRKAEIFWRLHNRLDNRAKGDLHDVAQGLLDYAFNELNLNCVYGNILEDNILAIKAISKFGFTKEGIIRERVFKNGKFKNQFVFSILKSEFVKQPDEKSSK